MSSSFFLSKNSSLDEKQKKTVSSFFLCEKEGNFVLGKKVWHRNDDDVSRLKDALQRNKNKTGNNKKGEEKREEASLAKVFFCQCDDFLSNVQFVEWDKLLLPLGNYFFLAVPACHNLVLDGYVQLN